MKINWEDSLQKERHENYLSLIDPYIDDIDNSIEFGCGAGHFSHIFGNLMGKDVVASDIHNDLEYPDLKFISINLDQNIIVEKNFDLVLLGGVIEHLENPYKLIRDLYKISNKYVIIGTPNINCLISKLYFLFTGKFLEFRNHHDFYELGHITPLYQRNFETYIKNYFDIIDIKTVSRTLPFIHVKINKGKFISTEIIYLLKRKE